jgi:hypothetical protein
MKELKVEDSKRTNDLSLEPGGSVVKVEYADGKNLVYDKIKNPRSYVSRIISDMEVMKVFVDDKLYWER